MIAVQVSTRTKLYFEMVEDTFPNKGGFYCKVYRDNTTDFPFGEFVIDRNITRGDRAKGNIYAVQKIKEMYRR
jgi:hypothetical protein